MESLGPFGHHNLFGYDIKGFQGLESPKCQKLAN
jgi:hypothetical protein